MIISRIERVCGRLRGPLDGKHRPLCHGETRGSLAPLSPHLIGPPQGSVPAPRTSVVYPQRQQQPHRPANTRASPSARPSARRARPENTKPQGHAAKDASAPAQNHTKRAPRGRKLPRSRGPAGRRRRCANAASEAPVPHQRVPRRTLASQPPRGPRDSDRSIASKTRLKPNPTLESQGIVQA